MPSANNRQSTAIHEAAHATVAVVLGAVPESVELFPRGGGECEFDPAALAAVGTEGQLVVFAAGVQAQRQICGETIQYGPGYHDYGLMREATTGLNPAWATYQRQLAHDRARQLVETHRQAIIRVANTLLDAGRLTGADVRRIARL